MSPLDEDGGSGPARVVPTAAAVGSGSGNGERLDWGPDKDEMRDGSRNASPGPKAKSCSQMKGEHMLANDASQISCKYDIKYIR